MIPFPAADAVWPHGSVRWRMCVLPRLRHDRALQRLVDLARKALAPFPLAEVDDADLNIGICPLELPTRDDLGEQLRRDLSAALAAQLADLEPFTLAVGTEHVGAYSVLLELGPDRWSELVDRVGAGLGGSLDTGQLGPMLTRPQLTLAYGAGHCDSAEVAAALRAALQEEVHAEVVIDSVHLVQVRQDAPGHGYRLAGPALTIALGGIRPAPPRGGGPR